VLQGGVECARTWLVLAQLIVGWVFYLFNFVAFMIYFTESSEVVEEDNTTPKYYKRWQSSEWRIAVFGTAAYAAIVVFLSMVGYAFIELFGMLDPRTSLAANVIGYAGSVFVVVQWAPQIYKTIKFKSSGSFSKLMILMYVVL
jgi:hypothetical protein